jgi:hypothetical protein
MYGFTTDEYGRLKTYLKTHKIKTEPSAISTSPVSPGPVMNHISNQNTVSVYPRQIHPEIQERRESSQELKSNIYKDCPRCKGKGEVQMWENVLYEYVFLEGQDKCIPNNGSAHCAIIMFLTLCCFGVCLLKDNCGACKERQEGEARLRKTIHK